jgi:predicted DNA-binding WGR domain protein
MRILYWFAPNSSVKNGMSSKIYKIERRGGTVCAWWGPAIWDKRTRRPKAATATCLQAREWKFRIEADAEAFLRRKLASKIAKGYHPNPRKHQ